jgi:hypothetical protein
MSDFPITAAQLSGNFCETLFYGMYLVTCTFCVRVLFIGGSGRDERWLQFREIRWFWVSIAFTLFGVCTFDTAIGLLHNFQAFVESNDPDISFDNIGNWINIARVRIECSFLEIKFLNMVVDSQPVRRDAYR